MASSSQAVEPELIISRMNAIRNMSEVHVADLHEEAQRLVDWREHVRAKPLLAVAAAAVVGYSVTSALGSGGRGSQGDSESEASTVAAVSAATVSSGAMALLGSLASAALRQYAMQKIRSLTQ